MIFSKNFDSRFLKNRDETGRYIVVSLRTKRKYYVEQLGDGRMADWGSYNPSTGEIENKKGAGKHSGSITESESMITESSGFLKENIHYTKVGESAEDFIERLDAQYPDAE